MTHSTLIVAPEDAQGGDVRSGCSPLLEEVSRQACRMVGADGAVVSAVDDDKPMRITVVSSGVGGERWLGRTFSGELGLTGRALSLGRPVIATGAERFPIVGEEDDPEGGHAVAASPIHVGDEIWGVITILDRGPLGHAREAVLRDLEDLSALASAVVQSATEAAQRERTLRAGVGAFGTLLDLRDGYTSDHTNGVVELCSTVGRELGLSADELETLHDAARLHDLGKIGVPDQILNKPGPLTGDEWEIMRRHPEWGASALTTIPGFGDTAQAVRGHHERWDGEGYPDGLAGADVPLSSRIITVCDAFHAMTSNRPYRHGLPAAEAIRRIRAGAGSQFDPAIVAAFADHMTTAAASRPAAEPLSAAPGAAGRGAAERPGRFTRPQHARRGGKALAEALARATRLPALAESRERALQLIEQDPVPLQELVAVVESDVALTVAVLRAAPPEGAGAIPLAVAAVDAGTLQTALGEVQTFDFFQLVPGLSAPLEQFRLHAVATKRASDRLVRLLRRDDRDEILTAALLHDVGKLVLDQAYDAYPDQTLAGASTPDERVAAERRELGMDHAALGGVLLRRWRLPDQLIATVERHHSPQAGGAAAVLRLADMLAHYAHAQPVSPRSLLDAGRHLGLSPDQLRAVMFELSQEATGLVRATRPNPLTAQEHAILKGLSTGKVYKEIGTELGIAASTVRTHCGSIFRKLEVIDRANAVLKATESGWL